jgi:hypothetical protein
MAKQKPKNPIPDKQTPEERAKRFVWEEEDVRIIKKPKK